MQFKKGDWAVRRDDGLRPQFGKVQKAYVMDGAEFIDIVLYAPDGERIGRLSPPLDGPTAFEPACPASNWRQINPPQFPLPQVGLYGDYRSALERTHIVTRNR